MPASGSLAYVSTLIGCLRGVPPRVRYLPEKDRGRAEYNLGRSRRQKRATAMLPTVDVAHLQLTEELGAKVYTGTPGSLRLALGL